MVCHRLPLCRLRSFSSSAHFLSFSNKNQSSLGRWCICDGVWVSSLFRFPSTLDRNKFISVAAAPIHFLLCDKTLDAESFPSRDPLSKSIKNWPRNEDFWVIVSEVGRFSLKWYEWENVYNLDQQRLDSLANTNRYRRSSLNWEKAKNFLAQALPEPFPCVIKKTFTKTQASTCCVIKLSHPWRSCAFVLILS